MSSDFLGFDFLSAAMYPTPDLRRGYTANAAAMPDLRRGYTADAAAMPDLRRGYTADPAATPDLRRGYTAGTAMSVDSTASQGIVGTHLLSPGV